MANRTDARSSNHFFELAEDLGRRYRTFRLIPKETSWFMKAIYYGLGMFLWCPTFMTDYTTTIVTWIYMPKNLIGSSAGYEVLRHEAVHVSDCIRTGVLPFVLSYILLLPSVLTLRAYWELRGYRETMRVECERTGDISDETMTWIAKRFTGSDYLWMLPFPKIVRRLLERNRSRILAEGGPHDGHHDPPPSPIP